MSEIFEKLNLTNQQEILVLNAPESFQPELARLPVLTIHHHIESVPEIGFFLAFVTRKSEVDALAKAVVARAPGDAIVWFAYPKGISKRFECDFNRDTGWDAMQAAGFDCVRAISIDEDWTAMRFRRVEYIKTRESNTDVEPVAAPKVAAPKISAPKLTPPEKGRAKPLPPSPRRRK
ncbi:MAG: hypothetical protein ABSB30_11120 [Terracidiphilus sp.]|jgi:hypothetical protein